MLRSHSIDDGVVLQHGEVTDGGTALGRKLCDVGDSGPVRAPPRLGAPCPSQPLHHTSLCWARPGWGSSPAALGAGGIPNTGKGPALCGAQEQERMVWIREQLESHVRRPTVGDTRGGCSGESGWLQLRQDG